MRLRDNLSRHAAYITHQFCSTLWNSTGNEVQIRYSLYNRWRVEAVDVSCELSHALCSIFWTLVSPKTLKTFCQPFSPFYWRWEVSENWWCYWTENCKGRKNVDSTSCVPPFITNPSGARQKQLTYIRPSLVRESMANPCMDFQKSTDINMNIHDFWMSVFNYPYKRKCPHWYPSTSMQGHSAMDIRKQ